MLQKVPATPVTHVAAIHEKAAHQEESTHSVVARYGPIKVVTGENVKVRDKYGISKYVAYYPEVIVVAGL